MKKVLAGIAVPALITLWTAGLFCPKSLPCAYAISVNIDVELGVRPRITTPADPITNLSALTGEDEGVISLSWTTPQMFPGVALNNYEIRFATNSVDDFAGSTTTWWNNAPGTYADNYPVPTFKGDLQNVVFNTLTFGATYIFAIKSYDELSNVSLIDTLAQTPGVQANAIALDAPPPMVTGLAVDVSTQSITLSWSASTATDVTSYRIYWDTSIPADLFTTTVTVPSNTTSYTFTDLVILNTYYFYVTALDRGLPTFPGNIMESTPSSVVSEMPRDLSPAAPSNFTALSIATNSVTWQWLDNSTNEDGFRIYSSTGGLMAETGPSAGSGSSVQYIEANLALNTSYSRYVRAFNSAGESVSSNMVSKFTLTNPPLGTALTDLFVSSITMSWNANNNPVNSIYQVQYGRDASFTTFDTYATTDTQPTLTALASDATYYVRVRAQNGDGVYSTFDSVVSSKTLQSPIQGLIAIRGNRMVALRWNASTDAGLAGYFIHRTTDVSQGFARINLTPMTSNYYEDRGLTNGASYFYKVNSINISGTEGPFSETVLARPIKAARPQEPTGIFGTLASDGTFRLRWGAVTRDIAGSDFVELSGYRIYKSTNVEGPFVARDSVAPDITNWDSKELVPPTVWYMVRAFDTSDNESVDSMFIETIAAPSLAAGSADGTMQIVFPFEEAKLFNSDTNGLSEDVRVTIERNDVEEKGTTLSSYEIRSFGATSGTEIKDLKITRPAINLQFRFHPGIAGAPLPAKTTLRKFVGAAKDVGIFWHNSVEFVKFGGVVDEMKGTIAVKTAKPLGKYQVRQVIRATEFTLNQLTPRKIFTPNGDGVNDEITLYMENPLDSIITQAKIYDITGAEIADFDQGMIIGSQGIISLKWNGKDKNGVYVRSGIYVYQVQAEGKVLNGTIVVAR